MKDGLIQQMGSPLQVYNEPVNKFVAGFIGSPAMNFLTGTIQENGSQLEIALKSFSLKVPDRLTEAARGHLGREVTAGIRPEHIYVEVDSFRGTSISQPIDALVEVYEAMGSDVILELAAPGASFVAEVDPNTSARAQEQVQVYFDQDRLQLFDAKTEVALA
jgi:multiple sugar transport system ATP-binding protein